MSRTRVIRPRLHTRATRPSCCKTGRATLRAKVGSMYHALAAHPPHPGFAFCPYCGASLLRGGK